MEKLAYRALKGPILAVFEGLFERFSLIFDLDQHGFNPVDASGLDCESERRDFYGLALFGKISGVGQDQASQGLVFARRKLPIVGFVQIIDLQPSTQDVGVFG